jgi:hypothetical protein
MQTPDNVNSYYQSEIDYHVIMQIVGSSPGFPHGIIDPIEVSFFKFFCLLFKKLYEFNWLAELP